MTTKHSILLFTGIRNVNAFSDGTEELFTGTLNNNKKKNNNKHTKAKIKPDGSMVR